MRRRTEDPEVVVIEGEGSSPWKWLLAGVAIGAGAALLFAPRSGEETRRELARQVKKLRASAEDLVEGVREGFGVTDGGAPDDHSAAWDEDHDEGHPDDGAAAPPVPATETRKHGLTARQELERRLADAKSRRRAPRQDPDEEPVA